MNKKESRAAQVEFLGDFFHRFQTPTAITLTFKQAIRHYRKSAEQRKFFGSYEPLDEHKASLAVQEFLKRLSRHVLLRKDFDRGTRIPSIAIMETSGDSSSQRGRIHYHLIVDLVGKPVSEDKIRTTWRKVKFAYDQIDIQPSCDAGWLFYSVKNIGKFCNEATGIDWNNCVRPSFIFEPKASAA